MESEIKSRRDGGIEEGGKEKEVEEGGKKRDMSVCDVVLRFLAVAFSLSAAAVLGVNNETTNVSATLAPINVPVTSKWHYVFVLFVVANATACCYATISLIVTLAKNEAKRWMSMMITFLDLVMVALLFYADGAAFATGLKGNSHLQGKKVCNVFDKFCNEATVAVALSSVTALAFFFLVLLSTLNHHNKH